MNQDAATVSMKMTPWFPVVEPLRESLSIPNNEHDWRSKNV